MGELDGRVARAAARLQPSWAGADLVRLERSLVRRQRLRRTRRVGSLLALCAMLATLFTLSLRGPATLRLDDGSTATPLDRATVLHVAGVGPGAVTLVLEHGTARFDVAHVPGRVFRVEVGHASIEVLGTRFVVERDDAAGQARVTVERGHVRLVGADGSQKAIEAEGVADAPLEWEASAVAVASEAPAVAAAGSDTSSALPPRREGPDARWRALALRGDFDRAFAALQRDRAEVRDTPEELLLAADAARLSRNPARALPWLERVVRRHATDPRAPLAAFTLGRVLLEDLGRPREAARAFARVSTLDSRSPLAQDAAAREVEALAAAGDREGARARAAAYLRLYPDGPRAVAVRRFGGLD